MALWLSGKAEPMTLQLDRACELKSSDEMKSVVRYSRHPLELKEIADHIQQGKEPTKLALTCRGRVSFTLTDKLVLRGIAFDESLASPSVRGLDHEGFDADVAIFTGEMKLLLPDLVAELGDYLQDQ